MKKLFIILSLLVCTTFVFAEDNTDVENKKSFSKNEFYFSYGAPSLVGGFVNLFSDLGNSILEATDSKETPFKKSFGCLMLGYNFNITKHFSIGAFCNYETPLGMNLFLCMGKLKLEYGDPELHLYHCLNGGCIMAGGQVKPMIDFTVFGMKYFIDEHLAIYVENGLIFTSLLSLGVSYSL